MTRSELRAAMPGTVANIDEFRKCFGFDGTDGGGLVHSAENGIEWQNPYKQRIRPECCVKASESKPFVHLAGAKSKRQRKSEEL